MIDRLLRHERHAIAVSAHTGAGFAALEALIAEELPAPDIAVDVLVPYSRGDLVSRIHEHGEITSSTHEADGTRIRAKVGPALAGELAAYVR